MKKFILLFLKQSLLTIFLYVIVVFFLGITKANVKGLNFSSSGVGRINLRINDISQYDTLDILFLGSSHSFMSFDPRIFKEYGFRSFNFGSLAQSPIQTEYLYNRYAKNIETNLIVFEVNPMIISNEGIESNIDLLNSIEIDYSLAKMSLKSNNFNIINTLVFRSIQDIFGYNLKSPELGSYIKGSGYAPTSSKNKNSNMIHKKQKIKVNDEQILALKNLVEYWEKNNIKFLLVQAPITRNYYSSIINTNEIDSIFSSLGSYANYNLTLGDLNLNDTLDFVDYHHLNQNGVGKFNTIIIKDIKDYLN